MGPAMAARLDTLGTALADACPHLRFAYLFGSQATGRAGPRSDIDVAVYLEGAPDPVQARLDLAGTAAVHLGTDHLDLVVLNSAPLSLAGRILQTRRVLVDRDPFLRHRYESLTARMFHDFRIREHRMLAQRFARG